jgi:hypothetical protein
MFANHIVCASMPIMYNPHWFTLLVMFIHFALFLLYIFLEYLNHKTNLLFIYGTMCSINLILIVSGLVGVGSTMRTVVDLMPKA